MCQVYHRLKFITPEGHFLAVFTKILVSKNSIRTNHLAWFALELSSLLHLESFSLLARRGHCAVFGRKFSKFFVLYDFFFVFFVKKNRIKFEREGGELRDDKYGRLSGFWTYGKVASETKSQKRYPNYSSSEIQEFDHISSININFQEKSKKTVRKWSFHENFGLQKRLETSSK